MASELSAAAAAAAAAAGAAEEAAGVSMKAVEVAEAAPTPAPVAAAAAAGGADAPRGASAVCVVGAVKVLLTPLTASLLNPPSACFKSVSWLVQEQRWAPGLCEATQPQELPKLFL